MRSGRTPRLHLIRICLCGVWLSAWVSSWTVIVVVFWNSTRQCEISWRQK